MGWNEQDLWTDPQAYFQQIMAVESQDRPTIGLEIAQRSQPAVKRLDPRQIGQHNEVMYLACAAVALMDRADLHRQQKAYLVPTGWRQFLFDRRTPAVLESVP